MRYGTLDESESDSSLLSGYQSKNPDETRKSVTINIIFLPLIALVVLVVSFLGYAGLRTYTNTAEVNEKYDMSVRPFDSHESLTITASNEYGVFQGPYPWLNDIPGSQLVEPMKRTLLKLGGSAVERTDVTYNWTFPVLLSNSSENAHTDEYIVLIPEVGTYPITVMAINAQNEVVAEHSTLIICKFVKREIRSLTTADRNRFLDAAAALWSNSQEQGVEKYGNKFTSIDNFVAVHSAASNDNMCDQFHEGTGFLTHHLALTNSFEAAIRSVDASVTLPYWDFTIEGQTISDLNETPSYMMQVTPVFSDMWFGSVDENNHIVDSRWAHSKMPKQLNNSSGDKNSFGYMRSYWNNNPDPEITRHLFDICGVESVSKKIPNCGKHLDVLNSATLGDFLLTSPAEGHGPMHVGLGGMWGGCSAAYGNFSAKWGSLLDANMTADEIEEMGLTADWEWGYIAPRRAMIEVAVMGEYFHIYRSFWRSHMCAVDGTPQMLVCPDSCDQRMTFDECPCTVEKLVNGTTTWQNLFPCVIGNEVTRAQFLAVMPDELSSDIVYMMATSSVLEGEMIESSSPADIIFWLIHPCIERLLSAKRLTTVASMNGFQMVKWPQVDGNNETWVQESYYNFEVGANPYYNDTKNVCYGHGADDNIIEIGFMTHTIEAYADTNLDGFVSNWEFYRALDPNILDANDYVFDNFDWPHCDNINLEA